MSDSAPEAPASTLPVAEPSHPSPGSGRWKYLLTELVIVTAGVLIALSVDSYREWSQHRALVDEARRNIRQEIIDNTASLQKALEDDKTREAEIDNALTLVKDLLKTGKSSIKQMGISLTLLDVGDANWKSAERTGALGHMEYAEVRKCSELYEVQALYTEHKRRQLEHVTSALATIDGDPTKASTRDLELLRERLLALRTDRFMSEKMGHDLLEAYTKTLGR